MQYCSRFTIRMAHHTWTTMRYSRTLRLPRCSCFRLPLICYCESDPDFHFSCSFFMHLFMTKRRLWRMAIFSASLLVIPSWSQRALALVSTASFAISAQHSLLRNTSTTSIRMELGIDCNVG